MTINKRRLRFALASLFALPVIVLFQNCGGAFISTEGLSQGQLGEVVDGKAASSTSNGASTCGTTTSKPLRLRWDLQDHAVIQRGKNFTISGEGTPNHLVTVNIGGSTSQGTVDTSGKWSVSYPPRAATANVQLVVVDECGAKVTRTNVSFGEVILCSGQSNMSLPLKTAVLNGRFDHFEAAKKYMRTKAGKSLHFLRMTDTQSHSPQSSSAARWATQGRNETEIQNFEQNVLSMFSSLCFFTGRNLQAELGVPVGMIVNSQGGTRVEEWMPKSDFDTLGLPVFPSFLLPKYSDRGPGAFYNSRMAPLAKTTLSTVIWYQGETNVPDFDANDFYKKGTHQLFARFTQMFGEHHVYMIQLANFGRRSWVNFNLPIMFEEDQHKSYAEKLPSMWVAQSQIADLHSNVHLVTAIDSYSVDEANCRGENNCQYDPYHPRNKHGVAYRVGWSILKNQFGYSSEVAPESPRVHFRKIENREMLVGLSVPVSSLDPMPPGAIIYGFSVVYPNGSHYHVRAYADLAANAIRVELPLRNGQEPVMLKYMGTANYVGLQLRFKGIPVLPAQTKLH